MRRLLIAALLLAPAGLARADEPIVVVLKDHRFTPAEVHVPAHKRVELLVRNEDPTADEFESSELKVEKVIGGGKEGTIRLSPLAPGRYPFMGEFHAQTAKGVVVAE